MKRHALDPVSLVAGIIVTGTAVVLLQPESDVTMLGQLFPLAIIAIGLALLFSSRSQDETIGEATGTSTSTPDERTHNNATADEQPDDHRSADDEQLW